MTNSTIVSDIDGQPVLTVRRDKTGIIIEQDGQSIRVPAYAAGQLVGAIKAEMKQEMLDQFFSGPSYDRKRVSGGLGALSFLD